MARDERRATHRSFAGAADFDRQAAYDYSQAAVGRRLGDYLFQPSDGGRPVRISDYRGKPLILSFVYSSCQDTCRVITQTLIRAVEAARQVMGADKFAVISVGFDALRDTPAAMNLFARAHGAGDANWKFLNGTPAAIEGLAADTGFIYYRSPKGFDHLTQTTLIDAEGKVFAQIYGESFSKPRLVEQLKQLVFGTRASLGNMDFLLNKVRLFCTIYDPVTDRYRFDYSYFIGMALRAIVLILLGAFLVRNWRRLWREQKEKPAT